MIAQSFRADSNLEGGLGVTFGAEGTAMLEIVRDIAPGAQLRFANFSTSLEFNAACTPRSATVRLWSTRP